MTTPLPVGPGTPYCVPALLPSFPTGVDWASIPPGRSATTAQRYAAQLNLCASGTAQAEEFCNQPLKANAANELFHGPGDFRVNIQQSTGNTRILLQRFPVMSVTAVQVAPNAVFPRQWTVLPAGMFEPEYPPITAYGTNAPSAGGQGGQAVIIAPGYVDWSLGRWGYAVQVSYVTGWPHTSLTTAASGSATSITVDNCTGWAPYATGLSGASGILYDGASQETIQVLSSSATAGPGTLTLATGLQYSHAAGVMASALPESVVWATALFAAAMALTRGGTATVIQETPGHGSAPSRAADLVMQAENLLHPFRRSL